MADAKEVQEMSLEPHYGNDDSLWEFLHKQGLATPFAKANIIKYVIRFERKGGIGDLRKAHWYIEKLMEWELKQ